MSLLYSVLKPIVRKCVKEREQREETYEDFVRTSHEIQAKFKLRLPKKKGFEFSIMKIDGCQVIVGHQIGLTANKALLYLVGGGERRWMLPGKKSMLRYMEQTGRDIWIPLYPLFPDHDFLDEANMILDTHLKMVGWYGAQNIAWLGFSAGADLIMLCGRHIVKQRPDVPMPGLMLPVSPCNLIVGEESFARMREIEKRDIMMHADDMLRFRMFYDPDGTTPEYILGNAKTDDYTGFPKIHMFFGGDEIFAGEAMEYKKAFIRCGVKEYSVHIEPGLFHAYPMFTFVKEGKRGEDALIDLLRQQPVS